MNLRSGWGYRWHAARLIQQRDLRSMLFGQGIYIVLSLSLLAAILILRNYLNFVDENGLLVVSGAFTLPLLTVVFLSSLFLALSSVTTIARERDQGTMETLFYGPVDSIAYVLGKYLAQLVTYLVMVVIYAGYFLLYASLTNFTFPFNLNWLILLSIFIASDLIAVGIFFSTLSSKVRTAVFLFLSIILIFLVIETGQELLILIPLPEAYYNPVLFLQNVFAFLNRVTDWLSPFSYLNQGLEAVRRGSSLSYLTTLLISIGYILVFLSLSIVALERKGVRK